MTLNCRNVSADLPMLLNGSLEAEAKRTVEEHLKSCADCSRQLRETATAWIVQDAHPSAEMLVNYAEREALPGDLADIIETHLLSCSQCSDAVDAVSMDLDPPGSVDSATSPRTAPSWLLAAAVLLAFGLGWFAAGTMHRPPPASHLMVTELLPTDASRSDTAMESAATVRATAGAPIALVLVPDATPNEDRASLRVTNSDQSTLLRLSDLTPSQRGDYAVLIQDPRLEGALTLTLFEGSSDQPRPLGLYRLMVERLD